MNLYAYVGNNPIIWIDPWGLSATSDMVDIITEGTKHGMESGYYKCLFDCLAGGILAPIFTKGAEEALVHGVEHGGADWFSKKYYTHKYPKWFKASGKTGKKVAPKLANKIKLGAKAFFSSRLGIFNL